MSTRVLVGIGKVSLNVFTTISHGLIDGKSQDEIWPEVGRTLVRSIAIQGGLLIFPVVSYLRPNGSIKQLTEHLLGESFMEQVFSYINPLKITLIKTGLAIWEIIKSLWE